jgi:hypothetical protein
MKATAYAAQKDSCSAYTLPAAQQAVYQPRQLLQMYVRYAGSMLLPSGFCLIQTPHSYTTMGMQSAS